MNERKVHRTSTRVRYGETDQMGIVYHAVYLQYFELGRTELFRESGLSYRSMEEKGYRLVVTEASCRYLQKALYDDVLEIQTTLNHLGRVRLGFEYQLLRGRDTVATGETKLACLSAAGKPTALPQEILECLKGWVA